MLDSMMTTMRSSSHPICPMKSRFLSMAGFAAAAAERKMVGSLVVVCIAFWIMIVPTHAAMITLTNGDFATYNSSDGTATGWTFVDGAGAGSTSNWAGIATSVTPIVAHIKSDGGNYIQQAITTSVPSGVVDAGTFGDYTINFDYGYQRDGATHGDHTLRFALWDTTTNVELAGQNLTILDPGVGTNSLSAGSVHLTYNTAGLNGTGLAFRVTSMSSDLGDDAWERTAMVTDFAITAIPEPASPMLLATGLLALSAYAQRNRKKMLLG